MFVDMRLRPPVAGWKNARLYSLQAFQSLEHPSYPRPKGAETHDMADVIAEMDDANIEWGVAMGRQSAGPLGSLANSELEELVRAYPDRFLAWAGLDVTQPMDAVLAEARRCAATGVFKGFSIEPTLGPQFDNAGDTRLYPLFELCQELRLPINISLSSALQYGSGEDLYKARPSLLAPAAKAFPSLQFHLGHAAWPFAMEAVSLAVLFKNVWLSPDMYLVPEFPGASDFATAARHYLGDRTLFGSAYPFKPLVPTVEGYRSWQWGDTLEKKIFRDNALRLMNML